MLKVWSMRPHKRLVSAQAEGQQLHEDPVISCAPPRCVQSLTIKLDNVALLVVRQLEVVAPALKAGGGIKHHGPDST